MKRLALAICALIAAPALFFAQQSPSNVPPSAAKPLLLERSEGEQRVRREPLDSSGRPIPVAGSEFMLKVSPQNNASQHLVAGMEDVAPGGRIAKHKHVWQDEILIISSGTARVWLGDQERDLHAGGLVFIPANTWISLQNTGPEPVRLTFVFSAPGFEHYMRCTSVPLGETPKPITPEERRRCAAAGQVVYENLQAK